MVFIIRFTQKQNAFIFHYNKHAEKKKVSHLQCNFRTSCSSKISFNGFVWFSGWAFLNLKALFRAWETVSPTHSASSACQSKLNIQLRISAHQKQHTWKTKVSKITMSISCTILTGIMNSWYLWIIFSCFSLLSG